MSEKITAPWDDATVAKLNEWQTCGWVHPFTCRRRDAPEHVERDDADRGQLVATHDGWVCPDCEYTQDWAHLFMAEGAPNHHPFR